MNSPYFDFETHEAYKQAMDFTLFVRSLKVAAIDRKVFNHLVESADSVVLNIAEGRGRRDEYSERIRRVGGMLKRLSR